MVSYFWRFPALTAGDMYLLRVPIGYLHGLSAFVVFGQRNYLDRGLTTLK